MSKTSKPVSLAPVKSLDKPIADLPTTSVPAAPAVPAVVKIHQPVAVSEMATKPAGTTPVPIVPAVAKAVQDKPVEAKAPAAVKPVAAKGAKTSTDKPLKAKASVAKPSAAKPAVAKPAVAKAPVAKAAMSSTPVVAAPVNKAAAAPAVSNVVTMPSAPVVKAPATKAETSKPVAAKSAAPKAAPAAPKAGPAQPAAFASLFDPKSIMPGFNLPGFTSADLKLPSFGADIMTTMANQMLAATRTMGEVQAALLDHGVAQLKAGMSELEACARSTTPSEVVVIQARAIRRSADDLTSTIKTVSAKAGKGFAKS